MKAVRITTEKFRTSKGLMGFAKPAWAIESSVGGFLSFDGEKPYCPNGGKALCEELANGGIDEKSMKIIWPAG